jgi:hypothetical protein
LGRLNPPRLETNSSSPDFNRNPFLTPDGGLHTFYPTLHEGESATSGVEYTRDGTYLRLKTASRQVELPDGTIHTFSDLNNGYLTRIEDRFGNFVRVEYLNCGANNSNCVATAPALAQQWKVSDTQGRTHWVTLRDTGQAYQPKVVVSVDFQALAAHAPYKLCTTTAPTTRARRACRWADQLRRTAGSGSNHSVWF